MFLAPVQVGEFQSPKTGHIQSQVVFALHGRVEQALSGDFLDCFEKRVTSIEVAKINLAGTDAGQPGRGR